MKRCVTCGEHKSVSLFHRCRSNKDGLQPRCKDCSRTVLRGWQAKNRERTRELARRDYAKYREERSAASRAYYWNNREARLAWFRDRPERDVVRQHERRANAGRLTGNDRCYVGVLRNDPCSYCGAEAGTIDHIEPLKSGGSGRWENLTASCRSCNASKRTATLLAFLARA